MLPIGFRKQWLFKGGYALGLFSLTTSVFAQTEVDISTLSAQTMLANIAAQVPYLMQMMTALAYVLGMYFIVAGIMQLKHFGESRTMMSSEHSLVGPIVHVVVGTLLLYLPTSVEVGLSTFWTDPNPYGYLEEENQWSEFINTCYVIVQLIGTIAFIRGLVILSHLGARGGGGQNTAGRGITHIIGGILCINIYQTIQVIFVTLGIQT